MRDRSTNAGARLSRRVVGRSVPRGARDGEARAHTRRQTHDGGRSHEDHGCGTAGAHRQAHAMIKKRRTYLSRLVGDKVMMPADLKRLHKYMLDIEHIGEISDEMRAWWNPSGPSWQTSCH